MSDDGKSLAELVIAASIIERSLLENDGELTPVIEQMMSEIDVRLPEKVEGYAGIMARMSMIQDFYNQKAKFYMKLAQGADQVERRCKDNLKLAMETLGVKEIMGIDVKFRLMETQAVSIDDETMIPEAYKHLPIMVPVIEKKKIAEDLKLGVQVPGASLKTNAHVRAFNRGLK